MPNPEHDDRPSFPKARNEPLKTTPLPEDLAEFLKDKEFAALLHPTENLGTIVVAKAPAEEIRGVVGKLPVEVRHELYQHPDAPVVRTVLALHDRPDSSLRFEMFTNIGSPEQKAEFAHLAEQEALYVLFYDRGLTHRLSKKVPLTRPTEVRRVLEQAERELRKIKPGRYDFDAAKAEVMARTRF